MNDLEDVIFLISQPRSGSSLVQHLIGSHTRVHTTPEPWLILNLVHGISNNVEIEAAYNEEYASIALDDFLSSFKNGKNKYRKYLRKTALSIYEDAIGKNGSEIFLDKTPRYYHIIPTIREIFPSAKILILIRKPISVFASILDTNMNGSWISLFKREDRLHDIFTGPRRIAQAISKYSENITVTHYESVVRSPKTEVRRICESLGLQFEQSMINYADGPNFSDSTFVDPKSIYSHKRPVTSYLDSWKDSLDTPEKVYIGRRYIQDLGKKLVNKLGYNYEKIIKEIEDMEIDEKSILAPWEIIKRPSKNLSLKESVKKEILLSIEEKGITRAMLGYAKNII